MRTSYRASLVTLSLALVLSLSACGTDTPQTRDAGPAVPVRLQEVQTTEVQQAYRYSGTVQGMNKVHLSTKMLGRITALSVEEGDRVRKGQVLARIKSQDVEAQKAQVLANLQEAQAGLTNAETNYRRMKTLHDAQSATRKEFEDASTHYAMMQARIAALQGKLREVDDVLGYAVVTAPIDGYVVQKMAEAGSMASPGMPLLVVENTQRLEIIAQVPETDIQRFAVGDTVEIEIGAVGKAETRGIVTQINPSGHHASRQFRVTVGVLGGARADVKSGMYARVVLRKGVRSVIAVPQDALIQRGQLTGLLTVDQQNRALLRWVRTGKQYGDHVEILSGLAEGEMYVAAHEGRLTDGQPVTILN